MKVLVTGACGFIGSHLVDKLIKQGYETIATDLDSAPKIFLNSAAIFVPADLSSAQDVEYLFSNPKVKETSLIFHLAAIFDFFPPDSVMFHNNAVGTYNLVREFAKQKILNKRFILFSSGAVYGDTGKIVSADENFPTNPKNAYARSKIEQEKILQAFLEKNPDCFEALIVRPAAVMGPRSRYGAAKIVELMAGGQIQFYLGRKKLIASLIHVDDVVNASVYLSQMAPEKLEFAANSAGIPVFNIVDNSRYSYEQLFDYASSLLKKSHNSRILKFHMPLWLLRSIGKWQEFLAKKYHCRPKYAASLIDFFEMPMTMNNFRLLAAGYQLKWPDTKEAIKNTVDWYLKEGWI